MGLGLTGFVRSAEGSSAVVNFVYLPMAIISGTFFSPEKYPSFLRAIADVLPLTYFTKLARDVMVGHHHVWSEGSSIAVVLLWGVDRDRRGAPGLSLAAARELGAQPKCGPLRSPGDGRAPDGIRRTRRTRCPRSRYASASASLPGAKRPRPRSTGWVRGCSTRSARCRSSPKSATRSIRTSRPRCTWFGSRSRRTARPALARAATKSSGGSSSAPSTGRTSAWPSATSTSRPAPRSTTTTPSTTETATSS